MCIIRTLAGVVYSACGAPLGSGSLVHHTKARLACVYSA